MNMFPSSYNTALNQVSLNTGAAYSKSSSPGFVPTPTPYPVPYPTLYPSVPTSSGIFGMDNTLTTIFYIGAALTLFSLIFFPRRTM